MKTEYKNFAGVAVFIFGVAAVYRLPRPADPTAAGLVTDQGVRAS